MSKIPRQRVRTRLAFVAVVALGVGCGGVPPTTPGEPSAGGSMTMTTDASCSPASCTGCCFNGVCQAGTSVAGCGRGGERCQVCDAGAYEICLPQQTCDLDPNGLWRFQIVAAQIHSKNGSAGWDPATEPLPDVYFRMGSYKSQTRSETLMPMWSNEGGNYKASDLTALGVYLELWDADSTSADDVIAPRSLFRFQTANLAAGEATLSGWGETQSVSLRFLKLPQ